MPPLGTPPLGMPSGARWLKPNPRWPFWPQLPRPVPAAAAAAATKLYLHDAAWAGPGAAPTSPKSVALTDTIGVGVFGKSGSLVPGTLEIGRAVNPGVTANGVVVSCALAALAAQVIPAGTWSLHYGVLGSSNLGAQTAAVVYVWRPSTSAVVGFLIDSTVATTSVTGVKSARSTSGAGASVTCLDGDVLVVEVWAKITTTATETVYYDGTTDDDPTSNAAYLLAPSALAFLTSTPVSNTAAVPLESLDGSPASSASAPLEAARGVATTAADPVEALAGIVATASVPVEETQNAAATASESVEATASAGTQTAQTPLEVASRIATSPVVPVEAGGGISSIVAGWIEALQGLASTALDAIESALGLATSESGPLEALGGVSGPASGPVESAAGIAAATVEPLEATQGIAVAGDEPVEALGPLLVPVFQTLSLPIETATGIQTVGGSPLEATGGVAAGPSLPLETAAPASTTQASPAESAQEVPPAQADAPLDVLGALLQTGELPVEAIGLVPISPSDTVGAVGDWTIALGARRSDPHLDDDEELARVLRLLDLL